MMKAMFYSLMPMLLAASFLYAGFGLGRNDFQVSGNTIRCGEYPRVGVDGAGNFIVTWKGEANQIFARKFNAAGTAVNNTFEITVSGSECSGNEYALAVSDQGYFVVAWLDVTRATRTYFDLYARRYSADCSDLDGGPVRLLTSDSAVLHVDAAINSNGTYVIAWNEKFGVNYRARARLYNSAGVAVGGVISVHPDGPYTRVGISAINRFVVTYSNNGIRGRIYDFTAGAVLADSLTVLDSGRIGLNHDIAMAVNGQIVSVVEEADAQAYTNILARRFTSAGSPAGGEIRVEYQADGPEDKAPSVEVGQGGHFGVAWYDWNDAEVHVRLYSAAGVAQSGIVECTDFYEPEPRYARVGLDANGRAVAVWDGNRENTRNIYFQRYTNTGARIAQNLRVNGLGTDANYACAAVGKRTGTGVIAFEYHQSGEIYVQRFMSGYLDHYPENVPVNASGFGLDPAVAVDSLIFVVWEDRRGGLPDTAIYLQRFDGYVSPLGGNTALSAMGARCRNPAIAMGGGKVLAAWEDRRGAATDPPHVFGQFMQENGSPQGTNFRISAETVNGYAPSVATGGGGTFAVAWVRSTGSFPVTSTNVFVKLYGHAGDSLTRAVQVNSVNNRAFAPSVDMDAQGNFVVAWLDQRDAPLTSHVYCQRFDALGDTAGENFRADTGATVKASPSVAVTAHGGFMVAWSQGGTGPAQIESQVFTREGVPTGNVRRHNNYALKAPVPAPHAAAGLNTILLAWTNACHTDTFRTDIWGEFSLYTPDTIGIVRRPARPLEASWIQIHPNPFCHSAWMTGNAWPVRVFDVTGRLVIREAVGRFGAELAPGTYFIRAENRPVKRIVKLK